ncbi:MAG: fatty acid desaturase CarF family protein [Pseudomonadota bacterium]
MSVSEVVAQVLLGIVLADVISGVVHWFEDTYGDPKWPIIGKALIEPNIVHHDDPLKFTKAGFWKRNRGVFAVLAVVAGGFALAGWLNVVSVTALVVGAMAGETHRWAHLKPGEVPRVVRWLQEVKVLQTAQHHWAHHRRGFNTHYCTITNAVNPTLDGLRVFRVIEGLVEGLTGIKPRTDREAYDHPMLGRRWLSRARRVACALTYTIKRRFALGGGRLALA